MAANPNPSKEYKGKSVFGFLKDQVTKEYRLYRVMDKDPIKDEILVYDFQEHVKRILRLSDWKKYSEKAYTLPEVCELIGRSYWYTRRIVREEMGWPGTPATYDPDNLDDPEVWRRWYFSKDDVLDIHKYMASIDPRGEGYHHKQSGRRNYPKPKNKLVKRHDMPTREEVLAKLNSDEIYYVKNADGEFVPVFKPKW